AVPHPSELNYNQKVGISPLPTALFVLVDYAQP
ncbi:MAG: hypothetical protein RLZZ490_1, partial [Cyanobacteriota bacterium]